MKKVILLFLVLSLFSNVYSQTSSKVTAKTKLLVYYFHLTNRCNTCRNIESLTKKVLEENFKAQLDDGTIVFKIINADLDENQAIAKKYNAYGATLALTPMSNMKELAIDDLTNFAFSKVNNSSAFSTELKAKISRYIKN